MRSIIIFFIKYPISGNTLMALILIFGLSALYNLKSNFFPEETEKLVTIQIIYPGASPQEIEEGVVNKIEENLQGITGLDRVTSTSKENNGTVSVEMLTSYDIDLFLQDVKNAVDRISSFPAGLEPLIIFKQENVNLAINFSIRGDVDLKTLKTTAKRVENDLRTVNGISKVQLTGYPDEEIEISFRENDLRAYNLTFDQATQAVSKTNVEITGGTIKGKQEELLVRAKYKQYYAKELENIVLKTGQDGLIIRLRDVADVKDQWADAPNRNYYNQQPAVIISVSNTTEEDILFITDYVKKYIEEFNQKNDILEAEVILDFSKTLQERIDLLVENGLIGGVLVLVFLSLFLNIYLSFWVAVGIPISFMGMFILGIFSGLTINVISLFGMIIVIGILVDDGIVISENIYQHYERGKSATQAAIDGTLEVVPSILTAVFTTIIAFSAFFFFEGRIGDFFSDLSFVVVATLGMSLIEGLFVLPGHVAHSRALKGSYKEKKPNRVQKTLDSVFSTLRDKLYAPVLKFAIYNKALMAAIFIGLLFMSISLISGGFVKTTIFPNVEQDNISVTLEMPAGTRDHITKKWIDHIEKAVLEVNQDLKKNNGNQDVILEIQKTIGPQTQQASMLIILLTGEFRQLKNFQIANLIREKAGKIPNAEKLTYGSASPFGKPISIALIGDDIEQLRSATMAVKAEMQKMPEIKDVIDTDQEGLREVNIRLKDKAYLLGLQVQDVLRQVRQGFFGSEAQRLQRGDDEVKVWVRYQLEDRQSIESLEDMRIRLADGSAYPLRELAEIDIKRGIVAINHLENKREIRIEADIANPEASLTDLLAEIETNIVTPIARKYNDVRVSFEGQSRESAKTGASAGKVMPIILIMMFALVVFTFRSLKQTLSVFLLLPFGFIGVIVGHWIHGAPISVLSFLGVIALIGVMINDSLVFVSAVNSNLKEGQPFLDAVYEAGLSRFRPILLTSVTTIAGLAPLILEKSFQAQFLIPMAISLAYGLAVATFVTLIALPVMLIIVNTIKLYFFWLWEGKKPTPESMETAIKELKAEQEAH
jgi:multidrug efflux pump subunit AcrB